MSEPLSGRDVLLEIVDVAGLRRVTAIDSATGEEAFAVGPVSASVADLKTLALRKLAKRLGLEGDAPKRSPSARPGRRI